MTAAPAPSCPVCGGATALLATVDFNKSCEEARGKQLPPSGRPVRYFICAACDFCFAPEFGAWTPADFQREIYNDGYLAVDPDHVEVRPRANAESLLATFGGHGRPARHLDYGGGAGRLSALLREARWDSTSWDPFFDRDVSPGGLGTFQLITCYEVFEHVADVQGLARNLSALLAADGLVLLSTLVSDGQLRRGAPLDWWYAAPRNGHISLHSSQSLGRLAGQNGFSFASFSPGLHVYWRGEFPRWASHLLRNG